MTAPIEVISFDLDDTLWPGMPTILAAEKKLYQWLSDKVPVITDHYDMMQLRDKRRALLATHPELAHDLTKLRLKSFEQLAEEFSLAQDWIQPAFELFYQQRQQVTLFDDVRPVLDTLSTGYRLASLTNGNADPVKTGVAGWFEFSLNSITAGSLKSEPAIYRQLQREMDIDASQHAHVGDDPANDVAGAKAAGAFAIWLNREQKNWPEAQQREGIMPDATISDLYALPGLLELL